MQILEMLYQGDDMSMVVVLPKEVDGITRLEDNLSLTKLNNWTSNLDGKREVKITFPKFKVTSSFSSMNTFRPWA